MTRLMTADERARYDRDTVDYGIKRPDPAMFEPLVQESGFGLGQGSWIVYRRVADNQVVYPSGKGDGGTVEL